MCDYSLMHAKSRPAVKDEELIVHNFGSGSCGFKSVADDGYQGQATAVCVLPGTQLALENGISFVAFCHYDQFPCHTEAQMHVTEEGYLDHKTAVFSRRSDLGHYHDALEFPDGSFVPVSKIRAGVRARVLQMPASTTAAAQETKEELTPAEPIERPAPSTPVPPTAVQRVLERVLDSIRP